MARDPHTQLARRRIGANGIGAGGVPSGAATANGAGDLVPNAIVVTTGDAIVVNLRRAGSRAPIFPDPRGAAGPHLRVVRGTSGSVR
jgi:hypothetical protein